METICRWYNSFCKNRYHWIYNFYFKYFDKNIQFTFEEENDETIQFLVILISRKRNDITKTVYQKPTCNDTYLNWNAFAPAKWKRGTLKTLVERAYVICSTDQLLKKRIKISRKSISWGKQLPQVHHKTDSG